MLHVFEHKQIYFNFNFSLFAAHSECAGWKEVRSLPMQLLVDLQELFPTGRMPAPQLQAHHQPGSQPSHPTTIADAGDVSRYLWSLPRYVLGKYQLFKTA